MKGKSVCAYGTEKENGKNECSQSDIITSKKGKKLVNNTVDSSCAQRYDSQALDDKREKQWNEFLDSVSAILNNYSQYLKKNEEEGRRYD